MARCDQGLIEKQNSAVSIERIAMQRNTPMSAAPLGTLGEGSKALGVLFGVALMSNLLASAVGWMTGLDNLFPTTMVLIGVVTLLVAGVGSATWLIPLVLWIVLFCVFSLLAVDGPSAVEYSAGFVAVGIPALLIGAQKFSFESALVATQLVGFASLPFLWHVVLVGSNEYTPGAMMGVAYACLPLALTTAVYATRPAIPWLLRLMALVNGATLVAVGTVVTSRGVFIGVLVFMAVLAVRSALSAPQRMLVPGIALVCTGILVATMIPEDSQGLAIAHRVQGSSSGMDLNGRGEIWSLLGTPRPLLEIIAGSGIGSFNALSGGVSPHSIFGQVYFELGVLALVALCSWMIWIAKNALTSGDPQVWVTLTILLSVACVRLSVSYTLWLDVCFWLLLGFSQQVAKSRSASERGNAFSRAGGVDHALARTRGSRSRKVRTVNHLARPTDPSRRDLIGCQQFRLGPRS